MVARVDGRTITVLDFQRAYQAQIQVYRGAYGGNISEQMLKQLGIDQQILQQMVDEEASLAEAKRRGIRVSDAELEQRILAIPAFNENGQFIGQARYAALLRMQRPPLTIDQFEQSLRKSLIVEKLRSAVTEWVSVAGKDVDAGVRPPQRQGEARDGHLRRRQIQAGGQGGRRRAGAVLRGAQGAVPHRREAEDPLRAWWTSTALRAASRPTAREVERSYDDSIELYSTPEQVRASHILLKTAGKKEDEVKAKAEQILKDVKAGGDFAALAKKLSEDEGSAKQGGDLDFFGRGRMDPAFEEAAFGLKPGEISDVVKSQYGFHIIKVTDKKAASARTLDEVRPQIEDQLSYEKANVKAGDLAAALEKEISKPADLDKVAKANGLQVQESGFFTREEPILGLGPSPQAAAEAFTLASGAVSGAVRVSRGWAFLTVTGTQASRLPTLDEAKDRVREDVTKQKAKDLALQKATAAAATLKGAADWTKAAKAAGVEVKTTELRGA